MEEKNETKAHRGLFAHTPVGCGDCGNGPVLARGQLFVGRTDLSAE